MNIEIKPQKYTLLAEYKFVIENKKQVFAYFYKYTGLYIIILNSEGLTVYDWFINKNVCNNSINIIKTKYGANKIHLSKNKRNKIELSPEGECFFACPLCDYDLYIRNLLWENNNGWEKCEKDGILLDVSSLSEKNEINENDCIKDTKSFVEFMNRTIAQFLRGVFYFCDVCDDEIEIEIDNNKIYFCKDCLDNKNQIHFNLCNSCYKDENILKHTIEFNHLNKGNFILKEV